MKADGTGRRKIISERIVDISSVSPDGRWIVAGTRSDQEQAAPVRAFAVDGSETLTLCVLLLPTELGRGRKICISELPKPAPRQLRVASDAGLRVAQDSTPQPPRIEDTANTKATTTTTPWYVQSAVSPSLYAYTRQSTRRNLYRIQLP
jgi:hypothetical protein